MKGRTYYSDRFKGTPGNYNWEVSFDLTDGYLGINQIEDGKVKDRVLLSPAQVKELVNFASGKKAKAA